MRPLCDTDSDVQLALRFPGKSLGRLGVQERQLVVATAGNEQGPNPLRRPVDIQTGEFPVRYAAPPTAEHHMREPLVTALRAALA